MKTVSREEESQEFILGSFFVAKNQKGERTQGRSRKKRYDK